METLLSWINALACGLISLALIGAIVSPRVHDGVVIKIGLICLALGFGAIAPLLLSPDMLPFRTLGMERALMLVNAGIAVVIVGYLMRKARTQRQITGSTDWAELVGLERKDKP